MVAGLFAGLGVGDEALGVEPVGSQFQVNTYTTGSQSGPSVATHADGDFVVVWTSTGSAGSDSDGSSIQGQRYDAGANPVGSQFQVNTYTTGLQTWPSIAVDVDGDFVVVWESDGSAGSDQDGASIQGQRYDASGSAVGSQFQVNTWTPEQQVGPSVATGADGDFVIAWSSLSYTPSAHCNVRARRYSASGNPVGSDFRVNAEATHLQWAPSVAADADGEFVVVWEKYAYPSVGVLGRRYDASGNPVGSEFQIFGDPPYIWGRAPAVAAEANGGFVVVWQSYDWYSGVPEVPIIRIHGRHYDASGNVSDAFQVNTYEFYFIENYPAVAVNGNGGFVVTWESYGSPGTDAKSLSIQGQRFNLPPPPPLIPSLTPPGVIGLGLMLFGIAAAGLRGRLLKRA